MIVPRRAAIAAGVVGLAVTAAGVVIVRRDRRAEHGPGTGTGATAPARTVDLLTTPPGATVLVGGSARGVTPYRLDVEAAAPVAVELRKPGYLPERRTVHAGAPVAVALEPVVGFEGTWELPSGELHRLVRDGDAVIAGGRRFQFVPSTGATVSFAAEAEHVDPRAPDEPSCRVPIRMQYDYDVGGDELELRAERVRLDFTGGACTVAEQGWADPTPLGRIDRTGAGAAETADWAVPPRPAPKNP